jgi:hypothetical protein
VSDEADDPVKIGNENLNLNLLKIYFVDKAYSLSIFWNAILNVIHCY